MAQLARQLKSISYSLSSPRFAADNPPVTRIVIWRPTATSAIYAGMVIRLGKTAGVGARKVAAKMSWSSGPTGVKMSPAKERALNKAYSTKLTAKAAAKKASKTWATKSATHRKAASKKAAQKAATYILSAPRGARVLTHREIKQAVEKVFEERYGTDG